MLDDSATGATGVINASQGLRGAEQLKPDMVTRVIDELEHRSRRELIVRRRENIRRRIVVAHERPWDGNAAPGLRQTENSDVQRRRSCVGVGCRATEHQRASPSLGQRQAAGRAVLKSSVETARSQVGDREQVGASGARTTFNHCTHRRWITGDAGNTQRHAIELDLTRAGSTKGQAGCSRSSKGRCVSGSEGSPVHRGRAEIAVGGCQCQRAIASLRHASRAADPARAADRIGLGGIGKRHVARSNVGVEGDCGGASRGIVEQHHVVAEELGRCRSHLPVGGRVNIPNCGHIAIP